MIYLLWSLLGLAALLAVLLLAAVLRTLLLGRGAASGGTAARPLPVDHSRAMEYAQQLAPLIRCETISSRYDESRDKFYALHRILEETFPLIHAHCEKKVFNGSLLFRWKGSGKGNPIMLMSHHDVVEANGAWSHPPFGGDLEDGRLWGRGTVDTKTSLYCIMRAVEELLQQGFTPAADVYIASSCTEEWSGEGAPLTAQYLQEQGITLGLLLDEGGMIMEKPIAGVNGKFAMVGVLEKGYGDLKFIARSGGGHASAPGNNTPLVRLARFICQVEKHPRFRAEFSPTVREMFSRLSVGMGFGMRFVFTNLWLLGPLLRRCMRSISPSAAAMLQTTCAFTTAAGSVGLNVLPQEAYVTANLRFIPHQAVEESIAILRKLADKYDLETQVIVTHDPCPVVDYSSPQFALVEETIRELFPDCAVSPYVMTGGTDVKFYNKVCRNGLRFAPLEINQQQHGSIHGLDENISVDVLPGGVDFYKRVIEKYR